MAFELQEVIILPIGSVPPGTCIFRQSELGLELVELFRKVIKAISLSSRKYWP